MSAAKKTTLKNTKPTKTAPKKVAAKKTITKATKTAPRKVAAKKTSKTAAKKVVAAKSVKKVPVKAARAKATPVSKKAKPAAKTTAKKRATSNPIETVEVPTNAPLRSIEKAAVLRTELSLSWQHSMYTIAYVSGFCFLLIGATFASANIFNTSAATQNSALVAATTGQHLTSKLTLQSPVPAIITSPSKVLFTLTNVVPESVAFYFINQDTQKTTSRQPLKALSDEKYTLTVDPEALPAGDYKLYIHYAAKGSQASLVSKKAEAVAAFRVPESTKSAVTNEVVVDKKPALKDKDVDRPAAAAVSDQDKTDLEADSAEILPATKEPTLDSPVTAKELVPSPATTSVEKNIAEEPVLNPPNSTVFSLYTKETTVSGVLTINSVQDKGLTNLELYARPVASLNPRFLTRASHRSGKSAFTINTQTFLPNGEYEFYAQGTNRNGQQQITPSLMLTIKNAVPVHKAEQTEQTNSAGDSEPVTNVANIDRPERDFAPLNLVSDDAAVASQDQITKASEELLKDNAASIEKLFKQYGSARQSGDAILIKVANEALTEKKVELANAALVDRELAGISDDVIEDMSARLADLQNRADTFEKLRSQKSAGASAIDSDGDGIPDHDEINLYGTDPHNPDTDGDGFTDGIEIMRGFDPLQANAEVAIEFQSPQTTVGLVQETELVVQAVQPVVNSIPEDSDARVLAQISGRGLPNSFVTLYIYSSPTIVTIKTEADGSFVYTLDQELADGKHQVYVALTDNAGAIVAQSNPFSFVKEAQAFTPVDAAATDNVVNQTVAQTTSKNSYNAVVGLGVLSFGLILIILGMSLRAKEEEIVSTASPKPLS